MATGTVRNLVTGGAGFIGSHLAEALLRRGEQVRIFDDFSSGRWENLAGLEAAEVIEGDVRDPRTCERACAGVDYVFHEAAIASVQRSIEDPETVAAVCATGTLNILQAARRAGIKRLVYAGSASAYGDEPTLPKIETMATAPRSPYAAAKLAGEQYCAAFQASYGLAAVVLRYFNIFGPRQDPASQYSGVIAIFMARLLAGQPCTIFGDGEATRDFVYVDNVVEANLRAREVVGAAGGTYNVGCGTGMSMNELYRNLAAAAAGTGAAAAWSGAGRGRAAFAGRHRGGASGTGVHGRGRGRGGAAADVGVVLEGCHPGHAGASPHRSLRSLPFVGFGKGLEPVDSGGMDTTKSSRMTARGVATWRNRRGCGSW